MPEPTASAAAATLAAATSTVPVLIAFGVPLGLRPDVLIAGFAGSVSAMALLVSVPAAGDTWRNLARTSLRRMAVALASSATAGYMTPLTLLAANVPEPLLLGMAFLVGAGAQHVLERYLKDLRTRRPPSAGAAATDTGRGEP